MSYAPDTLQKARTYILKQTNLNPLSVGIVGSPSHTYGYHLGADRLPRKDYSNAYPRDRNGLTDAASALDIGKFPGLVKLTAFLVAEAKAGRLPDVREIIGPGADGRAYRWAWELRFEPRLRAPGDSHEDHVHLSYWRDSENRTKLPPFVTFFEDRQTPDDRPSGPTWTERIVRQLPVLRKGADGPHVKILQGLLHAHGHTQSAIDGDFGPKTEQAVKAFQRRHRLDPDGAVGPKTWAKLLGV